MPFIHNKVQSYLDHRKYYLFIFMITPLIDRSFCDRYCFASVNSFNLRIVFILLVHKGTPIS